VEDVKAMYEAGTISSNTTKTAWVVGTIIGSAKDGTTLNESGSDVDTNIALAKDASSTDFIPVQLKKGGLRTIANVVDNTANVGKEVNVYGTVGTYFSVAGVKPTSKIYGLTTIEIKTTEGYATYYNKSCAYEIPEGVQGGIVTNASSEGGALTIDYMYNSDSETSKVVPTGSALLLYNNGEGSKSYNVVNTSSASTAESGNILYGYADNQDASGNTSVEGDYYYYKLTYLNGENLGFYWGADNGAGFVMTNQTGAFLAVSTASAAKSYSLFGETTGINAVNAAKTGNSDAVFTLSGVRVNANKGNLPKGLYIVNGKKVLVK